MMTQTMTATEINAISTPLHPQVIGQRYQITDVLVASGSRMLLAGRQRDLDMPVIIERLTGLAPAKKRLAHARFAALQGLSHPNLARVLECFEARGALHLVMTAGPCAFAQDAREILPVRDAISYTTQICDALNYLAWRAPGLGFPWLAPDTIAVTAAGRVKLLNLTALLGVGAPHTPAATMTALGRMMARWLTGQYSEQGNALATLGYLRPDCPPELQALIGRTCATSPRTRWRNTQALRYALLDVGNRL